MYLASKRTLALASGLAAKRTAGRDVAVKIPAVGMWGLRLAARHRNATAKKQMGVIRCFALHVLEPSFNNWA